MSAGALISVEEYLNTSYDPDVEYVDGALVERHAGDWLRSLIQRNQGRPQQKDGLPHGGWLLLRGFLFGWRRRGRWLHGGFGFPEAGVGIDHGLRRVAHAWFHLEQSVLDG